MSLLLNWEVYSVQLGTILPKYLIRKIVKISPGGNLNRIYKFYSGRILMTACFSHSSILYFTADHFSSFSVTEK